MVFYLPPTFRREGVVAGFVLRRAYTTEWRTVTEEGVGPDGEAVTYDVEVEVVVASLAPVITKGVLFANGAMYRPAEAPAVPAMPANALRNLYYHTGTGFYWADAAANAGDACLGWARSDGAGVIAVCSRRIGIGPDETLPVSGGVVQSGEEPGVIDRADRVVTVVNQNVTLTPGEQIVDVTATTQNCILTLPDDATMPGLVVKVVLAPSSTYSAILRPATGQKVNGASGDYELSEAGSSVTIEATGTGNWLIVASAGTVIVPAAPNAPNVTFTAPSAFYGLAGHASVFGVQDTINLPTGHADYSHLERIDVVAYGPAGQTAPVCSLYRAQFAGATIAFKGGEITQSEGNWTLKAWVFNEDGVATPNPASAVVAVQAAKINSISNPRVVGSWTDPTDRMPYAIVGGVPVFNGNQVPQVACYLVSEDNGAHWIWAGDERVDAVGQEITLRRVKPAANATWKLAMVAGYHGGDASKVIADGDLETLYPGVARSAGIAVAAMAAPGAELGLALTVEAGAGGDFPYNDYDVHGKPYWKIPSISYSDAGLVGVGDAFFVRITAQDYDAAGNAVGPEHAFAGTGIAGAGGTQSYSLIGAYGTDGDSYKRTGNLAFVRLRRYVGSRKNQTTGSFSDPTSMTRQTDLYPGGVVDVAVAAGAATPEGKIPATEMDPTTIDKGLTKDPTSGKLRLATGAAALGVMNPDFEDGLLHWTVPDLPGNGLEEKGVGGGYVYSGRYALRMGSYGWGADDAWNTVTSEPFGVRALQDEPQVEIEAKTVNISSHPLYLWIAFYKSDGSYLGGSDFATLAPTSIWTLLTVSAVAPADATRAMVVLEHRSDSPDPGMGWYYVDNVQLKLQVPIGPGLERDGRGGSKAKTGPGATINAEGQIVPNLAPGSSVGLNPYNQLFVPPGTLGNANFGAGLEAYGIFNGAPVGAGYAGAPSVIIDISTVPWKVKRKKGDGTWTAETDPADIVGGTITALLALLAPVITGGTITGAQISSTLNGVTIEANGGYDAQVGANTGLRVRSAASPNYRVVVVPGGIWMMDANNKVRVQVFGDGTVYLHDSTGQIRTVLTGDGQVLMYDASGAARLAMDSFGAGHISVSGTGASITINGRAL